MERVLKHGIAGAVRSYRKEQNRVVCKRTFFGSVAGLLAVPPSLAAVSSIGATDGTPPPPSASQDFAPEGSAAAELAVKKATLLIESASPSRFRFSILDR